MKTLRADQPPAAPGTLGIGAPKVPVVEVREFSDVPPSDCDDAKLWRAISELTIADQLCTIAHREPLENFSPWALAMSRNLSARERTENPDPTR
jgi:hypothetical protein